MLATRSMTVFDCHDMCGVMKAFGAVQSGWPTGNGSGSVTSTAAPLMRPSRKASESASVSTIGPRAMLHTNVFPLRRPRSSNSRRPMSPRVDGLSGSETTSMSRSWLRKSSMAGPAGPENQRLGMAPSWSPVPGTQKPSWRRDSGVSRGRNV